MNCGNIKCAYKCVQRDQVIEKEKTERIDSAIYAIRLIAEESGAKEVEYKALEILEKILKKEEMI